MRQPKTPEPPQPEPEPEPEIEEEAEVEPLVVVEAEQEVEIEPDVPAEPEPEPEPEPEAQPEPEPEPEDDFYDISDDELDEIVAEPEPEVEVEPEPEPPRVLSDRERILRDGPRSRREFGIYIEKVIGPCFGGMKDIIGTPASGEMSPVDAMWESYCLLIGRDVAFRELSEEQLSRVIKRIGYHANRGGGKTLNMAVVGFTVCNYNPNYWISWTAKQDQQVDQAWMYFRMIAKSPEFVERFDGPPGRKITKDEIRLVNGSLICRVSCTIDGLNSKHPNSFFLDEVERMDWRTIAEGLLSTMPRMDAKYPIVYLMGSTQKQARAIMFRLKKEAKEGRFRLIKWSWKSVVEPCPVWRRARLSGVQCGDWDKLTIRQMQLEEQGHMRSPEETRELLQCQKLKGQLEENCSIVSRCKGVAIKGRGFYPIEKLIADFQTDPDIFDTQIGCEQPVMENAVFDKFGEENLRRVYYNPGAEIVGAIDYGYVLDPTAIGLFNVVGSCIEQFYERAILHVEPEGLIPILLDLQMRYGVYRWSVDPSASVLKNHMKKAGLHVWSFRRDVADGLANAAKFIYTEGGKRRYFVNPDTCPLTVMQLSTYEKTKGQSGMPNRARVDGTHGEEGHHWDFCDMLRYMCNMMSESKRSQKVIRRSWDRN